MYDASIILEIFRKNTILNTDYYTCTNSEKIIIHAQMLEKKITAWSNKKETVIN